MRPQTLACILFESRPFLDLEEAPTNASVFGRLGLFLDEYRTWNHYHRFSRNLSWLCLHVSPKRHVRKKHKRAATGMSRCPTCSLDSSSLDRPQDATNAQLLCGCSRTTLGSHLGAIITSRQSDLEKPGDLGEAWLGFDIGQQIGRTRASFDKHQPNSHEPREIQGSGELFERRSFVTSRSCAYVWSYIPDFSGLQRQKDK